MRMAFSTLNNSGRFSKENYTLESILAMRDRLADGIIPGEVILLREGMSADMGEGAQLLTSLIEANVNDKGQPKRVAGEAASVLLDRLEILNGTEGLIPIDGRTRILAIYLHFAITGKWLDYPFQVVDVSDEEAERLSLSRNNLLRTVSDWRARTAAFIAAINQGLISSETEGKVRYNIKRGSAQHAWASAMACKIHKLDLSKCADGLNAADWRLVKECKTVAEAEAIAYDKAGKVAKFSAPEAARKALLRADMHSGHKFYPILAAIAKGDAQGFDEALANG